MSFRIVFSIIFLIGAIFLDRFPTLLISSIGINTLISLIILFVNSTLVRFHIFVPSLILHVITFFFNCLCLLEEVNQHYGIHEEKKKSERGRIFKGLRLLDQNMMAFGTLVSVAVAIIVGILVRSYDPDWNQRQLLYIGFIGEMFLRMLKCLILPLIFSSLVFAIGNIDAQLSGKIALRAITFYMTTTVGAIITGIVLVVLVQPGNRGKVEIEEEYVAGKKITTIDTILDLVR